MAKSFTYLSLVSGPREPLWIALLALPVKIFGAHPDVIRLFGVIGFASLLLAFQLIARTLYGSLTAGIAALLLASSPWLIFRSTRGLREEASNARTLRPARAAPEEGMLAAPPRA